MEYKPWLIRSYRRVARPRPAPMPLPVEDQLDIMIHTREIEEASSCSHKA